MKLEPQIKCEVIYMFPVKDAETYFNVLQYFYNRAKNMRCSMRRRQRIDVLVTKIDKESVLLSLLKYSHKPEPYHDFPLVGYHETWARFTIKHWDSRLSHNGDVLELRRALHSRLLLWSKWISYIPDKIIEIMKP